MERQPQPSNVLPFIAAPRPDHAPPYRMARRDEPLVDLYAAFEPEPDEPSIKEGWWLVAAVVCALLWVGAFFIAGWLFQ